MTRSAVLVIQTEDGRVLFLRRAPFLRHYASTFCFPGGKCDGDESGVQGALRETREETGLHFEGATLVHLFELDATLPDGTPLSPSSAAAGTA